MNIRWDENKSQNNERIYGICFDEACEIMKDPFQISILNKRLGYFIERWISMGRVKNKIIVVGHKYIISGMGDEQIKIYSARIATNKERQEYERIRLGRF